jgi:hypothetical protein
MAYHAVIRKNERLFPCECEDWLLADACSKINNVSSLKKYEKNAYILHISDGIPMKPSEYAALIIYLNAKGLKHFLPARLKLSSPDSYMAASCDDVAAVRKYMVSQLSSMTKEARNAFLKSKKNEALSLAKIKDSEAAKGKGKPSSKAIKPDIFYDAGVLIRPVSENNKAPESKAEPSDCTKLTPNEQTPPSIQSLHELDKKTDELKANIEGLYKTITDLMALFENALVAVKHAPPQIKADAATYCDRLIVTITVGSNSIKVPIESVEKAYTFLAGTSEKKFDSFAKTVHNCLSKGARVPPYASKYIASTYVAIAKSQTPESQYPRRNLHAPYKTECTRPFGIIDILIEPVASDV